MRFVPTELAGVILIEPDVHRDARGFLVETWHARRYAEGGISGPFVQDNHTRSVRGTMRGLHLQVRRPQAKLVRVPCGEIYDVAVDVRRGSPTYGRWVGATLSGENLRQIYIPAGMAHGFCVLSETADVEYKCNAHYDPADEITIRWDDRDLAIRWPPGDPLLSERDAHAPGLASLADALPIYRDAAP